MSEKKPLVLCSASRRGTCPVCGQPSYSATGTHPQCAMAHADALSRANRKAAGVTVRKAKNKPWCKPCPQCKRQVASRRITCDCGHSFAAVALDAVARQELFTDPAALAETRKADGGV